MFFYYKGFSFIPDEQELTIARNGAVIARFPINYELMDTLDIIEVIDEVLEM